MKYFLNFLLFLTLLAACDGEESPTRDAESAYFPLQKGIFQVYNVTEVRYTASDDPQEFNYQLKAEVVDSFPSATGQYTYVIHRSIRESDADLWRALDTWSARKNKSEIIVSEGNTAYVKLKFPLRNENRWDGNIFNSLGEDEYTFAAIDQPIELDGITFAKALTVEQERNEDIIVFRDERKEVYALDVGLVYKEIIQLNYCTDDACLGQQKVDHGIVMKMGIREYGKQ